MVSLAPPVEPMLARLHRTLPDGDFWFEPKWDGFRCLAFRDGDTVDLRSRNQRPLARYFPEIVDGLRRLPMSGFVLDGELLAVDADGRYNFSALLARLHPAASRVELLARTTPATFIAFDQLACGDDDLTPRAFVDRRRVLDALLGGAPAGSLVVATPITNDRDRAEEWLAATPCPGVDGVVAKSSDLTYQSGKRAMLKIKTVRTVDCVVAGFRAYVDEAPAVASLLLGLYDELGELRHVGVASSFRTAQRFELFAELAPLSVALEAHPWRDGFALEGGPTGRLRGSAGRWTPEMTMDWVPLSPVRVCEVAYDQRDGIRFRHPARFLRWRPDRDAASCSVDQLTSGMG